MTEIILDSTAPEAVGDWYVDHDTCMGCGAPPVQAPDLMGFGENLPGAVAGNPQCYFRKQPVEPDEVVRACVAAKTSCCDAVRYRGANQEILRLLEAK